MKRSGFTRPTIERKPQPLYAPMERRGSYAGTTSAADPKTEQLRNPFLLTMARGQSCLLRVPGVCNHDPATTVACHSNWGEHGKAGARKADDCWTVHGCSACHAWLDQGKAHHTEKRRAFDGAMAWMRSIWRDIVAGMQPSTPREKAAAQWAIDACNKSLARPPE